jgi:hypothetical protein
MTAVAAAKIIRVGVAADAGPIKLDKVDIIPEVARLNTNVFKRLS